MISIKLNAKISGVSFGLSEAYTVGFHQQITERPPNCKLSSRVGRLSQVDRSTIRISGAGIGLDYFLSGAYG